MKNSFRIKVLLPLLVVFSVLILMVPHGEKWGYEYSRGQSWRYETLIAQFDFPILKTKEQLSKEEAERSSDVIPYYKLSASIAGDSFRKIESLSFVGDTLGFKSSLAKHLAEIYYKGVIGADAIDSDLIYVQRDKKADKQPKSEVFQLGGAKVALLAAVSKDCPGLNVDSVFRANSVYDLVLPNLVYDEQLTSLVHARNDAVISTTSGYVNAGSIIVSSGELITAEVQQMLDSYKAEYEHVYGSERSGFSVTLGNILLVLGILVCLFFAIYFSNPMIFKDYNRYLYMLSVFSFMAIIEILFIRFAPDWIFIFPFSVGALYLQAFFKTRVIFPVYIVSLLPLLLFAENGPALFMLYLVPGIVTLYVFKYFSNGVRQFIAALINFAVTALIFLAFELLGVLNANILSTLLMLFIASMLEVAFYPFVFLLERLFNLLSTSRLQELADTSNELLRQLEQKAPGTFQHSLQVMNLASAAARAINADEFLIKAGALYHDIGKTKNPQCFVENESLVAEHGKYHSELTPLQSAQDIIRHVSDGLELAHAHKLPSAVTDFISTHHGTTCVSYFYDKFLKSGGDEAQYKEFCYPGPIPTTKEQVILMLCDSIEAASRSLKDYSPESISGLVDRIFSYKSSDGQLERADITVKELSTIKSVIKNYLGQMYHERIKYPKRK